MRITYIGHSSFLVETKAENYLFDYDKGEIPEMEPEKPLFVFASHRHADHFNPVIFQLAERYENITFVLSYDIKMTPFHLEKWQVQENIANKLVSVKANEEYEMGNFCLRTLKSTDAGVAFLLKTPDAVIYHAGDLNWWYWDGESKQVNNNMTANFKREMTRLENVSIDAAFVPLDPRQGRYYYLGLDYFLKKVKAKKVFPMHLWGDYAAIDRFLADGYGEAGNDAVVRIGKEGESFTI